ncbi:ATP-binding protein [Spirochaeta isovalerica]|uniref:Anti-sigma regulatory factor (Ser/Thr protein kinase) n=1 Tax=Spirochaeta isovalerica TaxID=150 RepID=A0A841R5W4_9SPIO|nr:ATP-binding protein [Spirochaeta isovalerica]MBB6478409.1 anti-sigma regulatory factor (Ser/Thr protein kinase) [Spirochaeta isovalerica]
MRMIQFRGKEYKHINFNINSRSDLSSILENIGEMIIPGLKIEKDLFFHSISELVNNSICAHREKNVDQPVRLRFSVENDDLVITIRDKGKGFDTNDLPYNLDDPVSAIDINGKKFQIYREKYNYKRFGTGLFNAKKIFDSFELYFFDQSDRVLPYDSQVIEGTLVKLKTKLS